MPSEIEIYYIMQKMITKEYLGGGQGEYNFSAFYQCILSIFDFSVKLSPRSILASQIYIKGRGKNSGIKKYEWEESRRKAPKRLVLSSFLE